VCDSGYKLSNSTCIIKTPRFPGMLRENFDDEIDSNVWSSVKGGETKFSGSCLQSTGGSLVFDQPGQRLLMSTPFDAQFASFIQFSFILGGACSSTPVRGEGVVVGVSQDGIQFTTVSTLPYSSYQSTTTINVAIPADFVNPSLRIAFWQPVHSASTGDVWVSPCASRPACHCHLALLRARITSCHAHPMNPIPLASHNTIHLGCRQLTTCTLGLDCHHPACCWLA